MRENSHKFLLEIKTPVALTNQGFELG